MKIKNIKIEYLENIFSVYLSIPIILRCKRMTICLNFLKAILKSYNIYKWNEAFNDQFSASQHFKYQHTWNITHLKIICLYIDFIQWTIHIC